MVEVQRCLMYCFDFLQAVHESNRVCCFSVRKQRCRRRVDPPAQLLKTTLQSLHLASSPLKDVGPGLECRPPLLFLLVSTLLQPLPRSAMFPSARFALPVLPTAPALPLNLPPTAPLAIMMFMTLGFCFEDDG